MARVVWVSEAVDQLDRIAAYISVFDPRAATRMTARLITAAASLADFPNRGRPASNGTRELPSVPPYVIRYRVTDDVVRILQVRHGAQRPE